MKISCLISKFIQNAILVLFATSSLSMVHAGENEKRVWVSFGSDAVEHLRRNQNIDIDFKNQAKSFDENVGVFSIPASQLDLLSKQMHKSFNRCGGFFFHESKEDAINFTKKQKEAFSKTEITYTINNGQTVNSIIAQLNPQNMTATVDGMSSYFNRFYTEQSGVDASNWLMQHWQTIAANRTDISVELFNHSWNQPSVIATITGTTNPDEVVIIGGHLDSINGGNPSNGRAPGSDDNASGIAVITETLSAIVASDYRPARTVKIMGYAAEEVGLRGSREIATKHRTDNINVIGVTQFDMTGYRGSASADIVFISDYTNAAQTSFLADLIDTYFSSTRYQYSNCGYACSDHASWTAENFPASFPFEAHFNDSNARIHTSSDSSFDVGHATHFLQLSVAFVAELAKGQIGTQSNASLQFTTNEIEVTSGQAATITFSRTGDLSTQVSIDYATQNQTAVAGTDYTAVSGTITWEAQDTADKTIQINTTATTSDKTFIIALSNPQGSANMGPNDQIEVVLKASTTDNPEPPAQSSGGGSLSILLIISAIACVRRLKLILRF